MTEAPEGETISRRTSKTWRGGIVVGAIALALSGCANAPDTAAISSNASPGITSTQVNVGALATLSGAISADFAPIVSGVRAYFDWTNAHGGVWGRKVVLSHLADDGGSPSNNAVQARTLVQQDHVFSVVGVATAFFTAAGYLAQTGTPTFGYATENNWAGPKNLFAAYGSVVDYSTLGPSIAYVAHEREAKSIALLAYGVPQSAALCSSADLRIKKLGLHVGYADLSVPYGGDLTSDVLRMKQAHTDFVMSCMDVTGNVQLSRTMEQNGLTGLSQLWLDGYNHSTLQTYASLMHNVYFLVQHVPFQASAQFPGSFPGMEHYLSVMHRYAPNDAQSEVAMEGWLSADLFVQALRIAGPHPTQSSVIRAANQLTTYTGGGLTQPVNWMISHHMVTPPSCETTVRTVVGPGVSPHFEVVFNRGTNLWVCFPIRGHVDLSRPVPAPPGTPGA